MVYVVANDGQPLMPTERHGKVCRMLKSGMAKVVKKCPFTIQLQYESERNVQPVSCFPAPYAPAQLSSCCQQLYNIIA